MKQKKFNLDTLLTIFMLLTAFVCMVTFAFIQPFGDGPDEINRFKVVQFIYTHGVLPIGNDPEVLIDGYGASYAFQPILTYIIDGYLLRLLSFLQPSLEMQVFISRLVNVAFGLIMAGYVKKISNLIFTDKKAAWSFTLAVVFLPQNLFLHSYVNTDSMGFLSVAMILYALLTGIKDDFSHSSSLYLSVGIILCALSYYNCYGIVLCAVFVFVIHFFDTADTSGKIGKLSFRLRDCLKKGLPIAGIVLVGISWWFIRNALLYSGDFLALDARQLCAAQTGLAEYNPLTRDTYARLGIPVLTMIFGTDYYTLVWKSFIAMFGPMIIPTHHYIYMGFKYWFIAAIAGCLIPRKSNVLSAYTKSQKIIINTVMVTAILIPSYLAVYYSYTWEFQPQGRYFHPMLIPFMYFLAVGIQKLFDFIVLLVGKVVLSLKKEPKKIQHWVSVGLYHFLYAFLGLSLVYSVFIAFLNYYQTAGTSLF